MSGTYSSAKKTPVSSGRRLPITMYGDGPQLSPSSTRHLMQSTSGVDRFSFGPSFWQAHDDDEWKSADGSDNPSNCWHSLPTHNVTKIRSSKKTKNMKKSGRSKQGSRSLARRPDISNLSKEKRATGNDQTLPKHLVYDSDVDKFSFGEAVAQTLHQADMMVA